MSQNTPQDLWSKIFVIERDLLENQRAINRLDSSYNELLKKIDSLKDDIRSQKDIDGFDGRIKDLEEMVDSLRQEMPEMRLLRKMVFALVGFVLTAFLGLIWNNIVINPNKNNTMKVESSQELIKKVVEEYNKREQ